MVLGESVFGIKSFIANNSVNSIGHRKDRLLHKSVLISIVQTSVMACFSSESDVGLRAATFCFMIPQQFSIRFSFGKFPGHGLNILNPKSLNHCFTARVWWQGAPSCWKCVHSLISMNFGTLVCRISRYVAPLIV